MLGWAWEQLASLEAEAEQHVHRGRGMGARSQRKGSVWDPDTTTLVTEPGGPGSMAGSCFSPWLAAEVSSSELLVIPFLQLRTILLTQEVNSHQLI